MELRLRQEEPLLPVGLLAGAVAWVVRIARTAEQACSVLLKPGTARLDGVVVDRIQTGDVVEFDPHLAGLGAWDALRLSAIMERLGMAQERVALARLMVVKRIASTASATSCLRACRNAQRHEKERAMISKAEERFLADGGALRQRIEKGQLKKPCIIERKIGALLKKHPRVARLYKAVANPSRLCSATKKIRPLIRNNLRR